MDKLKQITAGLLMVLLLTIPALAGDITFQVLHLRQVRVGNHQRRNSATWRNPHSGNFE